MLRSVVVILGTGLWLALCGPDARADHIGPGNAGGKWHDSAFDIIAVDLNNPAALGPGKYLASRFNYQFSTDVVGGGASTEVTGTITPVLLTGGGTTFTPVAVGDTITFGGAIGFISTPFGGAGTFSLAAGTTVYAGLYWHAVNDGLDERMPVGYVNFTGSSFVVYGGGTGPGAIPPAVGTAISGSGQGFFQRVYDFSIDADPLAAVPEPSSLLLALTGVGLVGWGRLRRRRG